MTKLPNLILLTVAAGALATSCGGPRQITDTDRALAHVEGTYQCDVSRFTFDNLDEVDERLDAALTELTIDRDKYRDFKEFLAESPDLRALVRDAYTTRCS